MALTIASRIAWILYAPRRRTCRLVDHAASFLGLSFTRSAVTLNKLAGSTRTASADFPSSRCFDQVERRRSRRKIAQRSHSIAAKIRARVVLYRTTATAATVGKNSSRGRRPRASGLSSGNRGLVEIDVRIDLLERRPRTSTAGRRQSRSRLPLNSGIFSNPSGRISSSHTESCSRDDFPFFGAEPQIKTAVARAIWRCLPARCR